MTKISVYIILFHDLSFLDDILNEIYQFIDEIIIIDGPYKYSYDILKQLNLLYDETNKPGQLNYIINKYNIKYEYKVFDTEEEKRMYGYNKCSNDIVLLVDTDEFFDLNIKNINKFINTPNKFVGNFNIYNMCRTNINYNKITKKFVIFKKSNINALQHLDYLWLIGCKQQQKNIEYMDITNSLGTIYHQTLNRTKFNNIIKFVFYVSLYNNNNNNNNNNLLGNYKNEDLLSTITINQFLNIFVHSHINRISLPSINDNNVYNVINDVFLQKLNKYKNNNIDYFFNKEQLCLKSIPCCFMLDVHKHKHKDNITVYFDNVKHINLKLYEIKLNEIFIIHDYKFIVENNEIKINYNINNPFELVIELLCNETLDNTNLFYIKNII